MLTRLTRSGHQRLRIFAITFGALALVGCGDTVKGTIDQVKGAFAVEQQKSLFEIPVDDIPDAIPVAEALSRRGNPASYQQNGRTFVVLKSASNFTESGTAQVYPTNFHGNRTANGEAYDMFAMSAAHKTLPIPSYVRVTHSRTGRSIVARVNDRGPFMKPGVIELSFVAAQKLGIQRGQTATVELEGIHGGQSSAAPAAVPQLQQPTTRPLQRWTPTPTPATPAQSRQTQPEPQPRRQPIQIGVPQTPPPAPSGYPQTTGFDIQVGAFQNRDNADRLIARLRQSNLTPARVVVEPSGNLTLYKVRVGPYANRRDAEQATSALKRFGIQTPRIIAPQ